MTRERNRDVARADNATRTDHARAQAREKIRVRAVEARARAARRGAEEAAAPMPAAGSERHDDSERPDGAVPLKAAAGAARHRERPASRQPSGGATTTAVGPVRTGTRNGRRAEPAAGDALATAAPPRPGRRLVRSSGRYASAGRIIGVGLICFGIWLLLDASQLYNEAQNGGADGTRRSVAISILRPIADLSNALHLSGLVNWGDTALNRNGGPGSNQGLPAPVLTRPLPPAPSTRLPGGESYLPHGEYGHGTPPPPPPPNSLPPIAQPTTAHPLVLLDIGDSIGEDLGFGVGDVFSGDSYVHVLQEGQVDTGLVQQNYYNWPGHLQLELNKFHPGAVVIMMGANDDQNMNVNGQVYTPLSSGWVAAYTKRVQYLMEESLAAGARVIWVGLPPMGGGNITNAFVKRVNTIFETQAHHHPGVTFVPSWSLFAGPKGQFEEFLKINGSEVQVRTSDGLHLDPAGWDLLANALIQPMEHAWRINLHVAQ
jgi:lysophospholipase L1-like esterase